MLISKSELMYLISTKVNLLADLKEIKKQNFSEDNYLNFFYTLECINAITEKLKKSNVECFIFELN